MTDSHAERRAALIAAALAAPLALLTVLVVIDFGPLVRFDQRVVDSWYGAVVGTGWMRVFTVISTLTQAAVISLVTIAIAGVFGWRRDIRTAVWVASVVVISQPTWAIFKSLVRRPRPDIPDQISGWSFPSGHATTIAALTGVLCVVVHQRVRRRRVRRGIEALLVGLGLLVGLDRVFEGAHYPSDVVAGWLLGALVVFLTSALLGIVSTDTSPPVERPLSTLPVARTTLAVILNPIKVDDAELFKARVGRAARAAGWDEPLWFETTVDDAGASMARAAVAAGADVVASAGGDGTARVVCGEMAGRGIPVGVIPAGTGNLLARNLGIPLDQDDAVDTILNGQDRAIDVVRIEGDALPATRFVVMAGLGLDAAIMDGAPDALKARIGWPAYVVAGARHLRYPAIRVDISIDGAIPVRRRVRTVLIGNAGHLQAGIPLLPDAKIDDGLLDVVVIAPRRFFGWVPVVIRVLTRRRTTDDRLDRFTGHTISLTAAHPAPRQLDGDTVGSGTDLHAEIEPGLLLVRVPRH